MNNRIEQLEALRDLARVKVIFQLRAIEAVIRGPAALRATIKKDAEQ